MADIFVSYTSSDQAWADWIGLELQKHGHEPHVYKWEISGGGDIMAWMDERHHEADHVLCVISPAYLKASYSSWERRAAQWAAATKRPNFVLPVYVEACDPPTLLAHLSHCELYGVSEGEAAERLKSFLTPAAKPAGPVPFPGKAKVKEIASKTPAVFPGGKFALSNIPIAVPRHFVGREQVLVDIRIALTKGDGRVAITALHGLRGVGKTTLAAAYAERHRGDYRATWWIRAQTNSGMRADLVALGVRLGWVAAEEKEEPGLAAVMERLRHEGEGILLIFDNAADANSLRSYMPRSGAAQVLVTSNAPNWRGVAAPVAIVVWPKEIGADYLIARTGRDREHDAALALSETLGGLPLAHEQAAAYCERLGISLAEYQKRFDAAPEPLLDDQRDASREYHDGMTVAKTFALAIDEAAKLHPGAEPLIVHAALLAPEPIPLFLFAEAREKFGEPLASALAEDGLDEVVATLRAFALVDRETVPDERDPAITTDCIRLHRLVRQVAVARREGEARAQACRALIMAVAAVCPDELYDQPNYWPRMRRIDAFAFGLVDDAEMAKGTENLAGALLSATAQYRHGALADYAAAQPLYERALAIYEAVFGPEHSRTAAILLGLALLLKQRGDLAGAQPLCERALSINEIEFGPEHIETAISLNNLARLLQAQGDLARARPLFERALKISEKVLGPEHAHTAGGLNNLALLMLEEGDSEGAKSLFERAFAIFENTLGPEHPSTNVARANLAAELLKSGTANEAVILGKAALAAHEKLLGLTHPWTEHSARVTAEALDALGRDDEAKTVRMRYGIAGDGRKSA